MIAVEVKIDISRATAKFATLKEVVRDKATVRALNKVAAQAKVQAAREIRDAGYNVKISAIKNTISIARANKDLLVATVKSTGRPIPLINYGARQTKQGVSVQVKHARKTIPHSFIAVMPGGHKGVFVRVGAGHKRVTNNGRLIQSGLPIKELYGPSVPAAFKSEVVMRALQQYVKSKFGPIFEHELAYALGK